MPKTYQPKEAVQKVQPKQQPHTPGRQYKTYTRPGSNLGAIFQRVQQSDRVKEQNAWQAKADAFVAQRRAEREAAHPPINPVQKQEAPTPSQQAPVQKQEAPKANNTGLPDNLKAGVENLSGFSTDDVKVHYNSAKPAQLQAHAYAQGTDIHLGPGQEKHLPHEAWHVVQQKQGRVKPTMQLKGTVQVNDDAGLEREADVMGAQALQRAKTPTQALNQNQPTHRTTAQLTKTKTAVGTTAGAVALGTAGAAGGAALGSAVPVVGSVAGGIIGGALGAGIGTLIGYFLSKPKLYENNQADHYWDELRQYSAYKREFAGADTAYDRGTIIRYSSGTSEAFNALLHEGKVLYTYDKDSQLSIGSNAGPIKHAIVAGNKEVKAAGMAVVKLTEAQASKGEFDAVTAKVAHWTGVLAECEEAARAIIRRFEGRDLRLGEIAEQLEGDEQETVYTYKTCCDQLDHWRPEMARLGDLDHEDIVASKDSHVQLDNESGHYHPGPKTKAEAFEGWNAAGYRNLTWKSH